MLKRKYDEVNVQDGSDVTYGTTNSQLDVLKQVEKKQKTEEQTTLSQKNSNVDFERKMVERIVQMTITEYKYFRRWLDKLDKYRHTESLNLATIMGHNISSLDNHVLNLIIRSLSVIDTVHFSMTSRSIKERIKLITKKMNVTMIDRIDFFIQNLNNIIVRKSNSIKHRICYSTPRNGSYRYIYIYCMCKGKLSPVSNDTNVHNYIAKIDRATGIILTLESGIHPTGYIKNPDRTYCFILDDSNENKMDSCPLRLKTKIEMKYNSEKEFISLQKSMKAELRSGTTTWKFHNDT
ncbi:F-box domain-containing protein [bacterium]|nr:MAG: F-box domain-containing protein [bacterium]